MAYAGYMAGPERRRQILHAAKRVFAARGYHDTNISHICEDLGIGRGTLYQYFGSKKEVFAAIIEDLLERLRKVVESRPALVMPPRVRPETALRFSASRLREVLGAVFEDEASLRILLREAVGLDVDIDAIIRAVDEIVIAACVGDIEAAQRAGLVIDGVDARQVGLLMIGGIQKLALDELARPGREAGVVDLDKLAETVARVQLFGVWKTETSFPGGKSFEGGNR